jgi:hypothetical protein
MKDVLEKILNVKERTEKIKKAFFKEFETCPDEIYFSTDFRLVAIKTQKTTLCNTHAEATIRIEENTPAPNENWEWEKDRDIKLTKRGDGYTVVINLRWLGRT